MAIARKLQWNIKLQDGELPTKAFTVVVTVNKVV